MTNPSYVEGSEFSDWFLVIPNYVCFSYCMQDSEAEGCSCISCSSSWCPRTSAFPTGVDTPLPTAVTLLNLPTIPTSVSLDRALALAGVRCVSKDLERSAEVLVIGMASVLRGSYVPIVTGKINFNQPKASRQLSMCCLGAKGVLSHHLLVGTTTIAIGDQTSATR